MAAVEDIKQGKGIGVPRQLQNTHYDGADAKVKGQNYKYPHDYAHHWVKQQYLPDDVKDRKYIISKCACVFTKQLGFHGV